MDPIHTEIMVLGAGPGGYAAAFYAADLGKKVILVEQDINRALDASARFYCFQEGRLALSAPTKNFDRAAITAAYFGL